MIYRMALAILGLFATVGPACGTPPPKPVRVFVALCDNATQGIIPVPPKIGNGDDLDNNL